MSPTYEEQDLFFELEMKGLLHKLQISQRENQNLLKARGEIELKLRNYSNLYDQMPVGYVHLCKNGLIKSINKKAQILLDKDKSKLINRSFSLFVHPESLYVFSRYRVLMLKDKIDNTCEIKCFKKNKSSYFIAHLDGHVIKNCENNEDELIITLIDVTKQNILEESFKKEQLKVQMLNELLLPLLLL